MSLDAPRFPTASNNTIDGPTHVRGFLRYEIDSAGLFYSRPPSPPSPRPAVLRLVTSRLTRCRERAAPRFGVLFAVSGLRDASPELSILSGAARDVVEKAAAAFRIRRSALRRDEEKYIAALRAKRHERVTAESDG